MADGEKTFQLIAITVGHSSTHQQRQSHKEAQNRKKVQKLATAILRSGVRGMTMKFYFFLLVLLIVFSCEDIAAQSQDPLKERLDFLKTKLENHLSYSVKEGEGSDIGSVKFEAIKFEGCEIAWKSSAQFSHSNQVPQALGDFSIINQVSVELSSIDPARTKIYTVQRMVERNIPRALVLELKIRPGSTGFRHLMETTRAGRVSTVELEEKSFAFFFDTNAQSLAEDISKAFADANIICRSRMKRAR